MKCLSCGGAMVAHKERYNYRESGLDYVTIEDATVYRCPNCGDTMLDMGHFEDLHRAIAEKLAQPEYPLRGPEIRFIREYLGLSGKEFAVLLGVRAEMVSKWENDKASPGSVSERLIRLIATKKRLLPELHKLAQHYAKPKKNARRHLRASVAGKVSAEWETKQAA